MKFKYFLILIAAVGLPTFLLGEIFSGRDGDHVGTKATQKVGFYGATPTAQPHATAQAAVAATPVPTVAPTPTQAQINAIVTQVNALTVLVNQLRADLVAEGLIKGAP